MGKNCSQLICKGGCGKIRNNFEDFYSLSLEVQGKKTLKESFDKYISEEIIEDFKCDNCNKKVTVIKRNSFADLPNVMIIHLQRIIFNYDKFMNEKINSRLEFPKKLNLKNYSTESINNIKDNSNNHNFNDNDNENDKTEENYNEKNEDEKNKEKEFNERVYKHEEEYYEYELVGIVVHLGNANAGHYYSYINIQRTGEDNKMDFNPKDETHIKKWMNFNDSNVSNFNVDHIEQECFGGSSNGNTNEDNLGWGRKNEWDNTKNAYMLVYEKIKKSPINLVITKNISDKNYFKEMIQLKKSEKNIINYRENDKFKILRILNKKFSGSVSLDYDDTVISRADLESKNLYDLLFYNEDIEEYLYFKKFYENTNKEKRLLQYPYIKEVLLDNLLFLNDQSIYCNEYMEFFEKLILNIVDIYNREKEKEENNSNKDKSNLFFFENLVEILLNIVFNILPRNFMKENLNKIITNLIKLLEIYPYFSKICLEFLEKNKENLLTDLIFTIEETINLAYKNLIYNCILNYVKFYEDEIEIYNNMKLENNNNMNETNLQSSFLIEEKKPCVYKLLDYFVSMIPGEIAKIWNKMLAFLELFESLAFSDNEIIIDYLFEKEIIYMFIDLALGKDSPFYKKGESRSEIGNKIALPKFTPLLNTVSNLIRRCYTSTWTKETFEKNNIIPITFIDIKDISNINKIKGDDNNINNKLENPYLNLNSNSNKIIRKIYTMSEKDKEAIQLKIFYKKCIKDNYNNNSLSKLLAHLMFDNYELSKKRIFMIIELFNEGISLQDVKKSSELIFHISNINDCYQILRIEWIFGIPQYKFDISDIYTPKIYKNQNSNEKIFKYFSSLTYGFNLESFVERMLYKYQVNSEYLTILNYFFSIVLKNPYTLIYFDSLPHPKEENKKLKDYIFELANEEINRIFSVNGLGEKFEKQIKIMTNIMTQYEDKKKIMIENIENDSNNNEIAKYLIKNNYQYKFSNNYKMGDIKSSIINYFPNENLESNNLYCFYIEYEIENEKNNGNNNNENDIDNDIKKKDKDINYFNLEDTNNNKNNDINNNNEKNKNDNYNLKPISSTGEESQIEVNNSIDAVNGEGEVEGEGEGEVIKNENKPKNLNINEEFKENLIDLNERIDENYDKVKNKKTKSDNNLYKINVKNSNDNNYNNKNNNENILFNDFYNKSEENFFKNNFREIIDNHFPFRINVSVNKDLEFTGNNEICIRRIVLFNNSEFDYKVRFNFKNQYDYDNTYLPQSEIVSISKKGSLENVFTFLRHDKLLNLNEIVYSIDSILYDNERNNNKENQSGHGMKKSKSFSGNNEQDKGIIYQLPEFKEKNSDDFQAPLNDGNEEGLPIGMIFLSFLIIRL
jgi:hypothetical protein